MAQFYGLIGAHRTGKTTLAREAAGKLGVPFYETSISKTLASLGVNPQADMPFHDRLRLQGIILETLLAGYANAQAQHSRASLILVDRTPLDVLAYTRSEILRSTMDPLANLVMSMHEQRCFAAMNFNFAGACVVRPGIPMVADSTKATPNVHYQSHISAVMIDGVIDHRNGVSTILLGRQDIDIDSRVHHVFEHCSAIIANAHKEASLMDPSAVRMTN